MPKFTIPGKPFGKQRPKFTTRGKFAKAYTPKETIAAEAVVAREARKHFKEPLSGPVEIWVVAKFVPPKSWPKYRKAECLGTYHTQKPDWDNIGKLISDALNGIAYQDDAQVCFAVVQKVWAEVAETVVSVKPTTV